MATLLVINGAPGSGKSTLAAKLDVILGIKTVSKDMIKEFLFDTVGAADRERSALLGRAATEMLYDYARQLLASGQPVSIESPFWADFSADILRQLALDTKAQIIEIYCHTDGETRRQRIVRRTASGARHEGHVDAVNIAGFDDTVDQTRYRPLAIGALHRIDTTKLDDSGYQAIADMIRSQFR